MMAFNPEDPNTWPKFSPLIIAHDVARSRDRSTAVVGGLGPFEPSLIGIRDLIEFPQGLYGSARASELAAVDRRYYSNALIVADLSADETYGEVLYETFGQRVIGLHITRHGDGMRCERRPVGRGSILVYTIGRTYLIELFHRFLCSNQVRIVDSDMARRAYEQLEALAVEYRDTGTVYTCLPGKHDDLGISCAMLAWAAQHRDLRYWVQAAQPVRLAPKIQAPSARAWT